MRRVGNKTAATKINVENGEMFFKAEMDIFQSLSAIWDIGKHLLKNASLPEYTWNKDGLVNDPDNPVDLTIKNNYSKSPFNIPSVLAGSADQLVENATDAIQLVEMSLEALRKPGQTVSSIYNGIRTLNRDKIKQFFNDATGISNYARGGVRGQYQAGRHSVQLATIFFSGVKILAKGKDMVRQSGKEVTEVQKFIPDGTANHAATNALKNAKENNKLVKNIDNEKLLTENVVNGERKAVAIDKTGDVYEAKALNNLDEINSDVKKHAHASELAQAADDPTLYNQMKNHIINFINGKKFEKRINIDANTRTNVANKAGINLNSHQRIEQVQLKTSTGDYFVADEVYFRKNAAGQYEVVINEIKLSDATPFTKRQNEFLTDLRNGNINFELRNDKFNGQNGFPLIPQGTQFNVKAMIKTAGDGTVNGAPTFTKFNPQTNTWN